MAVTQFPDEWLAQSVEGLTPDVLQGLRDKADAGRTLWECVVAARIATDAEIIEKLAHRFRLKIADVSKIDNSCRTGVPEQLAQPSEVVPGRGPVRLPALPQPRDLLAHHHAREAASGSERRHPHHRRVEVAKVPSPRRARAPREIDEGLSLISFSGHPGALYPRPLLELLLEVVVVVLG